MTDFDIFFPQIFRNQFGTFVHSDNSSARVFDHIARDMNDKSLCYQFQVDLRHSDELNGTNVVEVGVDLTEFYQSVEWDILEVPAVR